MVSKLPLTTPSTCSASRQFLRMGLHQSWSAARLYTWPSIVLLYINDIVKNIGSNIRLFADDFSLFIIVDNPTTVALCLNSDLEKLSLGCYLVSHFQPFQKRISSNFSQNK